MHYLVPFRALLAMGFSNSNHLSKGGRFSSCWFVYSISLGTIADLRAVSRGAFLWLAPSSFFFSYPSARPRRLSSTIVKRRLLASGASVMALKLSAPSSKTRHFSSLSKTPSTMSLPLLPCATVQPPRWPLASLLRLLDALVIPQSRQTCSQWHPMPVVPSFSSSPPTLQTTSANEVSIWSLHSLL